MKAIGRNGLIAMSLFIAACARAPTQEMSDARWALSMAHDAGAQTIVKQGYLRAKHFVDRAGAALTSGDFQEALGHARSGKGLAVAVRKLSLDLQGLINELRALRQVGKDVKEADFAARKARRFAQNGELLQARTWLEQAWRKMPR